MHIHPSKQLLRRWLAVIVSLPVIAAPANVLAIGPGDLNSINYGTPFYNPSDLGCVGTSGTTVLAGSDNQEKAFNYFVSKGLTPIAAAGIVGNLTEESLGVNPKIVEAYKSNPLSYSDTIPPYALGTAGYGIAQWTTLGRQQGLMDAAKSAGLAQTAQGQVVSDLAVQLDYLWQEATTTYQSTLDKVKAATTIHDATLDWMNGYESPDPNKANAEVRISDAQDVLNRYGAQAKASTASAASFCGHSTNFATNFIVYKQCDSYTDYSSTQAERDAARAWNDYPYGHAADQSFNTVCNQGCGPSAMAMIITNLTGRRVTPDMTAAYGQAHGTADPGGDGSLRDMLGPVLGGHWGLHSTPIPNFNINMINQTLRSGGLVLAGGHMDNTYDQERHQPFPGPFSVGGHFVVIRAVTSDGKWLIGNSGGWPDNAEYDPVWILTHTTVHEAWALTRS